MDKDKLAIDNINLIYKFLSHYNINHIQDEILDILYIGYTKALNIYDESKGSFSTIAFECMKKEYFNYYTYAKREMRDFNKKPISLNTLLENEENELQDFIPDSSIDVEAEVSRKLLRDYIDSIGEEILTQNELQVFRYYYWNDLTILEIAEKLNKSRQYVSECRIMAFQKIVTFCKTHPNHIVATKNPENLLTQDINKYLTNDDILLNKTKESDKDDLDLFDTLKDMLVD